MKLKTLGWNGITLAVPQDCDDIVHGKRHLLIEKDFRPILELRWEQEDKKKKIESLDSIRQQFLKVNQTLSVTGKPPIDITGFTGNDEVLCFRDSSPGTPCTLVRKCRECQTLVVCQLYDHPGMTKESLSNILASLSCHSFFDEPPLWATQDFRLRIPGTHILTGYNFAAGFTRLALNNGPIFLYICRLAPAADKLREKSLDEILMALHEPLKTADQVITEGNTAECFTEPSILRQVSGRLKRKKPFSRGIITHDQAHDRLLAVIAESNHPIEDNEIVPIYASYEIV